MALCHWSTDCSNYSTLQNTQEDEYWSSCVTPQLGPAAPVDDVKHGEGPRSDGEENQLQHVVPLLGGGAQLTLLCLVHLVVWEF